LLYGGRQNPAITGRIISELQTDLAMIGYFCPPSGAFDEPTEAAVRMFQEHFFGDRDRVDHPGQVHKQTAELIKAVASIS